MITGDVKGTRNTVDLRLTVSNLMVTTTLPWNVTRP